MRFSKAVVKHRIPILILTLLLMIPSLFGMIGTRINYDMLDYLPEDMDTVIGQNELLEDFVKPLLNQRYMTNDDCFFGFRNSAHIAGVNVSALKPEKAVDTAIVSANCL